jgi:peroxiredoxin family protein
VGEASSPQPLARVAVFLHSGDYDRLHQGLSIAATAAVSGRRVDVFFFWFALESLLDDRLAAPLFPGRPDLESTFEERRIPTAAELLAAARETGLCTTYACTGSLTIVGARADRAAERVDHLVGWSTILQVTLGVTDRFYL